MADLPKEVVTDILSRLPVKPLLRFRCASKPWLDLIDSSSFIKSHLKISGQTRNNGCLIVREDSNTFLVNADCLDVAHEIEHPLKQTHQRSPHILRSCNGLLLLCYEEGDDCLLRCEPRRADDCTIVVWNPSTRKYHTLPIAHVDSSYYKINLVGYGMGYDFVHDDYKVVRIIQFYGENGHTQSPEVKVYSLKSNTWRRIRDFPYYLSVEECHGVLSNGALHWIVSNKFNRGTGEGSFLVSLDLATEEYGLVPMPDVAESYKSNMYGMFLEVLEGCLCIFCHHWGEGRDLWVMKSYCVKESWTKLISQKGIFGLQYLNPLAFSKDGTQVLVENRYNFVWFDLESNTEKRIEVHGLPGKFSVEFVMQSLVPVLPETGSRTHG